jgi:hypothetical protein
MGESNTAFLVSVDAKHECLKRLKRFQTLFNVFRMFSNACECRTCDIALFVSRTCVLNLNTDFFTDPDTNV